MAVNSANPKQSSAQDPLRIPVVAERLAVGTRTVGTGRGVRVHKTVIEQPVTIDEALGHGEVHVRHVAVGRIAAPDEVPATRYEGDTLAVPVLGDVLVVERRVRIKEEPYLTRLRHERQHQEAVVPKAEQVRVDRVDESGNPPLK